MGLLTFAGRIVLVVINIVFILFALVLIIAGFIIRFAHEWLRPQVEKVLDKIEELVNNVYVVQKKLIGLSKDRVSFTRSAKDKFLDLKLRDASFTTDDFEFGSLVSSLCYIMIAVGVVLLAISFVGCCGACCSFTTLMLVYSIVLIVILVAQVLVVILVFAKPDLVKDRMKTTLKDTMADYDGIKGKTVSALGWNWAQQEYDCCGAESYADFTDKGSKYKDSGVNDNAAIGGAIGDVGAPVACCKTLPTTEAERSVCAGNGGLPAESDSNLNKGCVEEVWNVVVEDNLSYFFIGVGFCFALQIVLIIFACLVFKDRGIAGGLV